MTSQNYTALHLNTTTPSINVTKSNFLIQVNWYYSSRFWLALGVGGFFFNILELIYLFRQKKQKTIFGLTLTSLCIADILGSLTLGLAGGFRLVEYSGPKTITIYKNTTMAIIWMAGHGALLFSVGTSFMHIVIISIQRLLVVFLPIKFRTTFTPGHGLAVILVTWFLMFIYGTIAFFFSKVMLAVSYYMVLVFGITLVVCYAAVTYKLWVKSKERKLLRAKTDNSTKRVVLHSISVTVAFLVCTVPHSVLYIFFYKTQSLAAYHFVNCVIALNPLLDPLIYFFFYNQCSKYFFKKRSLKPKRTKGQSTEEIPLGHRPTVTI